MKRLTLKCSQLLGYSRNASYCFEEMSLSMYVFQLCADKTLVFFTRDIKNAHLKYCTSTQWEKKYSLLKCFI